MVTFLEKLMFVFFFLSIAITAIPFLKNKQATIDENAHRIIDFIITGTKLILSRFYLYCFATVISIIAFGALINFTNSVPSIRILLVLPSVLTSCVAGWISLHFSMQSIKKVLALSGKTMDEIMAFCKLKSNFILTLLISIILMDISIWVIGLDKVFTLNIFNLGEKLATQLGFVWSSNLTADTNFLNMKNLFIASALAGYAMGSTLHAMLARFNFSIFATSFDTASDLIGFSKYDFAEDDLRNPASVPDVIGDQLKYNYLIFSNLHSTSMIIVVAISVLGSLVGVINGGQDSINRIIFPIFFMSFGLFANGLISQVFKLNLVFKSNLFARKYLQVGLTLSAILFGMGVLHHFQKIPSSVFLAIAVGVGSTVVLYPAIYKLLSIDSGVIKYVASISRDSILSTITSGLFFGFLGAALISMGTCLILGVGLEVSSSAVSVFENLYLMGCLSLSLLVSSYPIIADTMSKPLIDNAQGVSTMLRLESLNLNKLRRLHSESNIAITYFKVINVIVVTLTASLFFFFFLLKSLRVANIAQYIPSSTGPQLIINGVFLKNTQINDFIIPFQIHFLNSKFIVGAILGACFLFGFIALIMWGVSVSYKKINHLMQVELSEKPAIWDGTVCPNYFKLIEGVHKFTRKFMLVSFVLVILLTLCAWVYIGVAGTLGFLIGQLITGVLLCLCFSLAGAIWSNAKNYIEQESDNIGTPVHLAVMFSDKLGDIFKDAIAPIIIDKIKFFILFAIFMVALILKFDRGF